MNKSPSLSVTPEKEGNTLYLRKKLNEALKLPLFLTAIAGTLSSSACATTDFDVPVEYSGQSLEQIPDEN